MQTNLKLLLTNCQLNFHWPIQGTRPSPKSTCRSKRVDQVKCEKRKISCLQAGNYSFHQNFLNYYHKVFNISYYYIFTILKFVDAIYLFISDPVNLCLSSLSIYFSSFVSSVNFIILSKYQLAVLLIFSDACLLNISLTFTLFLNPCLYFP